MAKKKPQAPPAEDDGFGSGPEINLEEDVQPAADISAAIKMAAEIQKREEQLAAMEEVVKNEKEEIRKLKDEQLPEMMKSLNLSDFALANGTRIQIKPFYSASIPTENAVAKTKDPFEQAALQRRRDECLAWLRKNGGEPLIKSEVTIMFGKGEAAKADKFFADVEKKGFNASKEVSVHAQTLQAFIKEKLEAGVVVPAEPFAVHVGQRAVFTTPKSK